ncbi:hypothetical protein LXA47_28630 [Massilia sp. P8910]|uniref:hypothetical protein n=1 Tax=Massilia antarctica TaxID=2765360 RepID=UPI001E4D6DD3|nr:hypothetical protein [Massilia antarctica]MCE3607540.1 hypothetical protein [Massilia antarctica]
MNNQENLRGAAIADLLDQQNVVAVVRYKGAIQWCLSDRDNWVLDWNKWWSAFAAAGHQGPALSAAVAQRSGIAVVSEESAETFLNAKEILPLDAGFLRQVLLECFPNAQSWWDVSFLFPVAFVDFDARRFAGFYQDGPRLEQYVPNGWLGEFADFANIYPEEVFPAADKFWIVDGRDLLHELNERGRELESGIAAGEA